MPSTLLSKVQVAWLNYLFLDLMLRCALRRLALSKVGEWDRPVRRFLLFALVLAWRRRTDEYFLTVRNSYSFVGCWRLGEEGREP